MVNTHPGAVANPATVVRTEQCGAVRSSEGVRYLAQGHPSHGYGHRRVMFNHCPQSTFSYGLENHTFSYESEALTSRPRLPQRLLLDFSLSSLSYRISCSIILSLNEGHLLSLHVCTFIILEFSQNIPNVRGCDLLLTVGLTESWEAALPCWMWTICCGCGSPTGSVCTPTSRSSTAVWWRKASSKPKRKPLRQSPDGDQLTTGRGVIM